MSLLRRWLEAAPAAILERPPRGGDEASLRGQLAAFAAGDAGGRPGMIRASREPEAGEPDLSALVTAALWLWQVLSILLDREIDLYAEDTEATSIIAAEMDERSAAELSDLSAKFGAPAPRPEGAAEGSRGCEPPVPGGRPAPALKGRRKCVCSLPARPVDSEHQEAGWKPWSISSPLPEPDS